MKRQHEPRRVVGDLAQAEIAEQQTRSTKDQITVSKLTLAKDVEEFRFDGKPIDETLARDFAGGETLAHDDVLTTNWDTLLERCALRLSERAYGSSRRRTICRGPTNPGS